LKELAKNPELRVTSEEVSSISTSISTYKKVLQEAVIPSQILGKRMRGIPGESEAKKRLKL